MALKVNKPDLEIIRSIAEHRLLTVAQIAALHFRNKRATGRRLKAFREAEIIRADTLCPYRKRHPASWRPWPTHPRVG